MSDIFREVDEDVRRDQLEKLWKVYGNLIVAAAVAVIIGVAGWQLYGHIRLRMEERASAKFQAALDASAAGKTAEAEALLASVIKKGPSGYAMVARFRQAADTAARDPAAGAKLYDALAADATLGSTLQSLAALRSAMLVADTSSLDELKKKLGSLSADTSPWHNLAREMLGLAALKAGDYEAAGRSFDEIITDPDAPTALRQRADLYLGIVKAGPLPAKP